MSYQTRLFLQLLAVALVLVAIFSYTFIRHTKTAFEEAEVKREQAQIAQVKQQFVRFGDEIARRVENIANSEAMLRTAMGLAQPQADKSLYVREAIGAAQDQNLEFLEITAWDGTVVSSTPDQSRVGHNNSMSVKTDGAGSSAFLDKQELRGGVALLLSAVRSNGVEGKMLHVIGGCRVENFLSSVVLPSTMRVLLYRNFGGSTFEPGELFDHNGVAGQAQRFAPLVEQLQKRQPPITQGIELTDETNTAEVFFCPAVIWPRQ